MAGAHSDPDSASSAIGRRFVECELKDLRVGDVKLLLAEYKLLAAAFDALQDGEARR